MGCCQEHRARDGIGAVSVDRLYSCIPRFERHAERHATRNATYQPRPSDTGRLVEPLQSPRDWLVLGYQRRPDPCTAQERRITPAHPRLVAAPDSGIGCAGHHYTSEWRSRAIPRASAVSFAFTYAQCRRQSAPRAMRRNSDLHVTRDGLRRPDSRRYGLDSYPASHTA